VIVVDSSVWIVTLRSRTAPEAAILSALVDADEVVLPLPVRLELLAGVSSRDRAKLRRGLSALPVAYPTDDTWKMIERFVEQAADAGRRFGVGDLLIAALAAEQGALVWSLDRDFVQMARLSFVSLYDGPAQP
jgi:predicted nucleic acid-binding protein